MKVREKGPFVITAMRKSDIKIIAKWAYEVFNESTTVVEDLQMKIKSIKAVPFPKQDIK